MNKTLAVCALAVVATFATCPVDARAEMPYLWPNRRAQRYNWHANYVYTDYGVPTALVVPPTADLQTNWSWGAPSLAISRIDHQFTRDYPGPGPYAAGRPFQYTPVWPQSTHQFGVYYVRGPWYPTQPDRVGKHAYGKWNGKGKHFGSEMYGADCQP